MRDAGAAPVDRTASRPAAVPQAADAGGARLRYLGGASVQVAGPVTRRRYTFSPVQPAQMVDARDVLALLRTRLFVRAL